MYPCKRSGAVDTISGTQPLTRDHQSAFLNSVESCFGNGQPRIVFDMIHVPLMDSVGIEALFLQGQHLFVATSFASTGSIKNSTFTTMR
jgi:anti-anti-sigma regulatory factor